MVVVTGDEVGAVVHQPIGSLESAVPLRIDSDVARRPRGSLRSWRSGSHRILPLAISWLIGSVPSSYLVARLVEGVDLRDIGTGTVSGSALYEAAGFGPLVVSGLFELGKGAVGPLMVGSDRPALRAATVALATVGHNWSPLLAGKGGRGSSVALGASLAAAPEGVVVLGAGMGLGRLVNQTAFGNLVSLVLLPILLWRTRRTAGLALALAMVVPALAKRALGNDGRWPRDRKAFFSRLVFDRDLRST